MRRGLHCLLVGVLTFSMSIDTAKACWHRRRSLACPPPSCGGPVTVAGWTSCPPFACGSGHGDRIVVTAACGPCFSVVDAGGFVSDHVPGHAIVGYPYEEVACGQAVACCGGAEATIVVKSAGTADPNGGTLAEQHVSEPRGEQIVESVTVAAEPTLAAVDPAKAETVPAAEAAPITIPPQTVADKPAVEPTGVPDLKSVEPVTALEPAAPQPTTDEPAATPAEPPATQPEAAPPVEPSKPKEDNIFEEVETAASKPATADAPKDEPTETPLEDKPLAPPQDDKSLDKPLEKPVSADTAAPDAKAATEEPAAKPASEPAPTDVTEPVADAAKSPVSEPSATEPGAPAAEPAAAPVTEPVEPPATDEKPAAEPDAADAARSVPREPMRRWIDATGSYATVGRFVDLRDHAIEIQKANGRTILVPLDRLSSHDRGYAVEAGARLAASRASGPAASETAGL